jgi:hypothetical protein
VRHLLVAAALSIGALGASAAPASARPYVGGCGNTGDLHLKPSQWSNGCTGGSLNVNDLRWTWYGETTASGKGRTVERVGCGKYVSCPGKRSYRASARVRMTQPRKCTSGPAKGSRYFSKVRVRVHYRKGNPFGYRPGWKTYRYTINTYDDGGCAFAP